MEMGGNSLRKRASRVYRITALDQLVPKPEWRGVNDVYWFSGLEARARGSQLDRNCFRIGGDAGPVAFAADGRPDGGVPGDHRGHQRDGILLPLSQAAALACSRRNLAGIARVRDCRPVRLQVGWRLGA